MPRAAQPKTPTTADLTRSSAEYRSREKRDSMYRVARTWVEQFPGDPAQIADGLGVILLTWNNAFYRYGPFDFDALERCLHESMPLLQAFKARDIASLSDRDHADVRILFGRFLDALKVTANGRTRRSPVAVAKALHILAPAYFPLWDKFIAGAYGCAYGGHPADAYLRFMGISKTQAEELRTAPVHDGRTLLKLIDEHNYVTITLPELEKERAKRQEKARQKALTSA